MSCYLFGHFGAHASGQAVVTRQLSGQHEASAATRADRLAHLHQQPRARRQGTPIVVLTLVIAR